MTDVSVGRIAPPPESTRTRHWAQVPPPATRRRHEQVVISEALHELAADRNREFELVVDDDLDVARSNQFGTGCQNNEYENQDDGREEANAQKYFLQYSRVDVHVRSPKSP